MTTRQSSGAQLRRAFEHYLDRKLIRAMEKSNELPKLGGENLMMFSTYQQFLPR